MELMRKGKSSFFVACACIAAGMGGELHIHMGSFGTIAMLDLVSYVIALPIVAANWGRMGKAMRRSLEFAFAWTFASMIANFFNFYDFKYWAKCVSLASSSWAIMAASYLLLRDFPMGYLWYLVGTGLGGWIGLYYFRNGSTEGFATGNGAFAGIAIGTELLMDKQIYPCVAKGVFYGLVLPWFIWVRKISICLVIVLTMGCGFWLLFHGGSRSNFGIFCAAAGAGFVVAYGSRTFKKLAKRPVIMILLAGIALGVVFGGYKMMAVSGSLGKGEQDKFENEFGEEGSGAVEGRAKFSRAFKDAFESCFIGKGWHIRNHSIMANSLACEGLIGFFFWLYFYAQVFWWVCWRMPYAGKWTTFIVLMVINAAWDVFGSPFGFRHKFFVLMTMIALCRDNKYYGIGSLFSPKLQFSRK